MEVDLDDVVSAGCDVEMRVVAAEMDRVADRSSVLVSDTVGKEAWINPGVDSDVGFCVVVEEAGGLVRFCTDLSEVGLVGNTDVISGLVMDVGCGDDEATVAESAAEVVAEAVVSVTAAADRSSVGLTVFVMFVL